MRSAFRLFALGVASSSLLCLAKEAAPGGAKEVPDAKGTDGKIVVEVHPAWAPLGAARVKELIRDRAWDYSKLFRMIHNFVAQWGIPAKPSASAK